MAQNILTKRNNETMEHAGFLYVFHKMNKDGGIKFWRCQHQNSKDYQCRGRLHTELNGNVIGERGTHHCPTSAENIGAQRVTTAIKRRAKDTMEAPSVLRSTTLENVPTPVLAHVPSRESIKQIVKRARMVDGEMPPAVPANLEEIIIPPNYQTYKRSEGQEERFLLCDSGVYVDGGTTQRILIFGRSSHVGWARDMQQLFVDGTFSLAPPHFSQIYAILARRGNWVLPVAYALLSNKSQATYERMWRLLTEQWPDLRPQSVSTDFELGAINAIRAVFPHARIDGCLFHLVRNMRKHLADSNLLQRYRGDPVFASQCRWITSMAFVPLGDLTPAIIAIRTSINENHPELHPILNWFEDNYTGRVELNGTRTNAIFHPEIWNVHHRTVNAIDRTNNYAEAAHRRLQRAFNCTHPSLWHFIDTIRREQKVRDKDMADCIAGRDPPPKAKKYRDADTRILNLVRNYHPVNHHPNAIYFFNPAQFQLIPVQTITDYLAGISHNYTMEQ